MKMQKTNKGISHYMDKIEVWRLENLQFNYVITSGPQYVVVFGRVYSLV